MSAPHKIIVNNCAREGLLLDPSRHMTLTRYFDKRTSRLLQPVPSDIPPQFIEEQTVATSTGCENGHRGVWFYDPSLYGTIEPGDTVSFWCDGGLTWLATGVVTGLADPSKYPKYASGINSRGFLWEHVNSGTL